MELRPLDGKQVAEIYETYMTDDFPEEELRPLDEFLDRMVRGIYECLGLYENEVLMAYGYFTKNIDGGYLLLDFLAVCPEYRSGGYGSKFMQMVKEYYREYKGILLECEPERTAADEAERDLRHRRIGFYIRNGSRLAGLSAVVFGVEFDILYLPIKEEEPQHGEALNGLYRSMFGTEEYRKYTKLL